MLNCDEYLQPTTLEEALGCLGDGNQNTRLLAGATDLLPWARPGRGGDIAGDAHIKRIVDISRIDELSGYEVAQHRIRIGANVTLQQFLDDTVLGEQLPLMPYCAIWFADDQIRRQATVVGNLVNASPAADTTPPMLALNAEVELAGVSNGAVQRRRVSLDEFVTGPGQTTLAGGEIVTAVECDVTPGYGAAFEKVGHRRSLVISVVCAACCVRANEDNSRFEDVRLALGGIGPVPVRLHEVEEALNGAAISLKLIQEVADMPVDRVASRTRQAYRRDVVRGFVERSLINALADCNIQVEQPMIRGVANG